MLRVVLIVSGSNLGLLKANAVFYLFENEIWFIIGILIAVFGVETLNHKIIGIINGALFVALSLFLYSCSSNTVNFLMGLLACSSIFLLYYSSRNTPKILTRLFGKYTLPIYLMHIIMAAGIRVVLFKLGIEESVFHIIVGLAASFLGPIIAIKIMELLKIDFLVYPKWNKIIKLKKSN